MADFDPDEFLKGGTAVANPPPFDPDEFLKANEGKDFWETNPQPVTPASDNQPLQLLTQPAGGIDTAALGAHPADPAWVASRGSLNLGAATAYAQKLLTDAAKHTLTPQNEPDDSEGTRFAPSSGEQKLAEKAGQPVINLPYPTGEGAGASTARSFIQKVNPIATVENASLAGLTGGLPSAVQKLAGLAFVAPMAKEIPEHLLAAKDAPTTKERFENLGSAAADAVLTYFGLKEGLAGRSRVATGSLRPTQSLPEWVKQETGQEINQTNPSPASVDGLLLAKEKAGEGYFDLTPEKQAERNTIIKEIDDQLKGMPGDAVKAGEERVSTRGQSPPPASEAPTSTANNYAERTAKIQEDDRRATPEERAQNEKDKEAFRNEVSKGDKIHVQKESVNDQGEKTTSTETYTVDDEDGRLVAYPDSGGPSLGLEPASGLHFFNTVGAEIQGGQVVRRSVTVEKVGKKGGKSESLPPASEEAPPVTSGGPPANGGTSSLFKQAQAEAGVTPEFNPDEFLAEKEPVTTGGQAPSAEPVVAENAPIASTPSEASAPTPADTPAETVKFKDFDEKGKLTKDVEKPPEEAARQLRGRESVFKSLLDCLGR